MYVSVRVPAVPVEVASANPFLIYTVLHLVPLFLITYLSFVPRARPVARVPQVRAALHVAIRGNLFLYFFCVTYPRGRRATFPPGVSVSSFLKSFGPR